MTDLLEVYEGSGIAQESWQHLRGHLVKIAGTVSYCVVGFAAGGNVVLYKIDDRIDRVCTLAIATQCFVYVGPPGCPHMQLLRVDRSDARRDQHAALARNGLLLPDAVTSREALHVGATIAPTLWRELRWHVVTRIASGDAYMVRTVLQEQAASRACGTVALSLIRTPSERQYTLRDATRLFSYLGDHTCEAIQQFPRGAALLQEQRRLEAEIVHRTRQAAETTARNQRAADTPSRDPGRRPQRSRAPKPPKVPTVQPLPPGRILRILPPTEST